MSTKKYIGGSVQIVDGTQGIGKVLTSDENGLANWAIAASNVNIYNTDGTLTANRTLTLSDKNLTFSGTSSILSFTQTDGDSRNSSIQQTDILLDLNVSDGNTGDFSNLKLLNAQINSTVQNPVLKSSIIQSNTSIVHQVGQVVGGVVTFKTTISSSGLNINGAYTLPKVDGTNNQVLTTNGLGVVTWGAGGSGGVNIYNTDGTLTADRTVSGDSKILTFDNVRREVHNIDPVLGDTTGFNINVNSGSLNPFPTSRIFKIVDTNTTTEKFGINVDGNVIINNAYTLPTVAPTTGQVLGYLSPGITQWLTPGSGGIWGIANSSGIYTYYSTWALARAAASYGQCIELFADITENSLSYTLKDGVNINGNGHTISSNTSAATLTDGGTAVYCDISNITIKKTGSGGRNASITSVNSIITGNCILQKYLSDMSNASLTLYGQLSGWTIVGANESPVEMFSTAILTNVYISSTNSSCLAIGVDNFTGEINNCVIKSSGRGIYGNNTTSFGGSINNCTILASRAGVVWPGIDINNCSITSSSQIALRLYNNCIANNCSVLATNTAQSVSGTLTNHFNNCTIVCESSSTGTAGSADTNYTNCKISSKISAVLIGGGGGKIINCHLINYWDNALGYVINEPTANTYIIDCILEVTNSGTTAIQSTSTPTLYLKGNSVKGTTNFKSAGIINGQTNVTDAQGNVILN
jgi:hypothetical protein